MICEFRNCDVDWYLFFDLYQVSIDIIDLTNKDDTIILIGDTLSYLRPLLEKHRTVYNFAFSNKPFGCISYPYAEATNGLDTYYTPTAYNMYSYFDYLDKKTILTRDYVRYNWNKIVLVDSSSGQSVHGVSIFFNRYIENITDDNMYGSADDSVDDSADDSVDSIDSSVDNGVDDSVDSNTDSRSDSNTENITNHSPNGNNYNIKCTNIEGSKPLQFIRLTDGRHKQSNIYSDLAADKKIGSVNYRPDLIILIGLSVFYHAHQFMIEGLYPRIVPFYAISSWNNPPGAEKDYSYIAALKNIKNLESMHHIYVSLKTNNRSDLHNLYQLIKLIDPNYSQKLLTMNKYLDYLTAINKEMIILKYNYYLDIV